MNRLLAPATCLALAGCRLGFEESAISTPVDAPLADLALDAGGRAVSFGERTTSMFQAVSADTFLDQLNPDQNNGADDQVSITAGPLDRNRALFRFDVSALPAGSRVVLAKLYLERATFGDEIAGELALHALAEPWGEGTAIMMATGGASWLDADTGRGWTMAGGSYGAALTSISPPSPASGVDVFTIPASVVQGWVDVPATNLGVAILPVDDSSSTHYHYYTREWFEPARRPELVVYVEDP